MGWRSDGCALGVGVGASLLGACRLRFQQGREAARKTRALTLAPRSAYVLDGAARWQWQHAIPPGRAELYSVTFRSLRVGGGPACFRHARAPRRSYTDER